MVIWVHFYPHIGRKEACGLVNDLRNLDLVDDLAAAILVPGWMRFGHTMFYFNYFLALPTSEIVFHYLLLPALDVVLCFRLM